MLAESATSDCTWFSKGWQIFPEMLAAIAAARESVLFETYIFAPGQLGERFREALVRARKRGLRVQVLLDAFGSRALPHDFWQAFATLGGEVRFFNPLALNQLGIRDHRKLLVCDGRIAFVGGFNIAEEYDGDGVTRGWCDLGVKLEGPLVPRLATSFEDMFARADFRHKRFVRVHRSRESRTFAFADEQLLLSGPGWGWNPIKQALKRDLHPATSVKIIVAYFLPTWRIRRLLARVVARGGNVELILAGKSDVYVSQLAAQSLYRRMLNTGIRVWEYEPQVLHAKLLVIDDIVYVGSANLDQRSLNINYELMVRFANTRIAAEAREIFEQTRRHCREVLPFIWKKSRTFWGRIKRRWAYFLLVRVDPYIARKQWTALPD